MEQFRYSTCRMGSVQKIKAYDCFDVILYDLLDGNITHFTNIINV